MLYFRFIFGTSYFGSFVTLQTPLHAPQMPPSRIGVPFPKINPHHHENVPVFLFSLSKTSFEQIHRLITDYREKN